MESLNNDNLGALPPSRWLIVTILLLSVMGILDATYLTIKRYSRGDINCSIFEGCDFVTASSYSAILGVPVAVLGIIFYISVFILSILYLKSKNKKLLLYLFSISTIGFLMSIWFIYTQAFMLNAFCLYCLVSAGLSTTIFILSFIAMVKYKNNKLINILQ